jgi:hypothetical protein
LGLYQRIEESATDLDRLNASPGSLTRHDSTPAAAFGG